MTPHDRHPGTLNAASPRRTQKKSWSCASGSPQLTMTVASAATYASGAPMTIARPSSRRVGATGGATAPSAIRAESSPLASADAPIDRV